jgi:3-hydroxyisobutyrate dehydrogenase
VTATLGAGSRVAFVGLGRMGLPMARRLLAAGYEVCGYDAAEQARAAFAATDGGDGLVATSAVEAARGAAAVVLMLPTSAIVADVLVDAGLLEALEPGVVVVDMGSSEPLRTRAFAELAAGLGVELIDAPVSGGVRGAIDGSLTIMVGGPADAAEACRELLETLGSTVRHVGPVGAGHALKALNNLLSATHLLASCEALTVARRFGLDPRVVVEVVNASTGRSASTERKLPEFILTESYDAGFAMALMIKDLGIAVALGEELGSAPALGRRALALWQQAAEALGGDADHTEIARWVETQAQGG